MKHSTQHRSWMLLDYHSYTCTTPHIHYLSICLLDVCHSLVHVHVDIMHTSICPLHLFASSAFCWFSLLPTSRGCQLTLTDYMFYSLFCNSFSHLAVRTSIYWSNPQDMEPITVYSFGPSVRPYGHAGNWVLTVHRCCSRCKLLC